MKFILTLLNSKKQKKNALLILAFFYIFLASVNPPYALAAEPLILTDKISQYGITWQFDKAYEAGQFANGDWWVSGPVVITSITPNYSPGRNGWEVNPKSQSEQAFDDRINDFKSALIPSLPYFALPNESIVKIISNPDTRNCKTSSSLPQNNGWLSRFGFCEKFSAVKTAAVLTVLASPPPNSGSTIFRPPYFGIKKPLYSTNAIRTDILPSLKAPQTSPRLDELEEEIKRVQLDHKTGWTGRSMHPIDNINDSYGAAFALRNGVIANRLFLDDAPQNKFPLLVHYIQQGIDLYAMEDAGVFWSPDGGHSDGRKLPIAFAGALLNAQEIKDLIRNSSSKSFGENGSIYKNNQGAAVYGQKDACSQG